MGKACICGDSVLETNVRMGSDNFMVMLGIVVMVVGRWARRGIFSKWLLNSVCVFGHPHHSFIHSFILRSSFLPRTGNACIRTG